MANNYSSFASSFLFPENAARDFLNIIEAVDNNDVSLLPSYDKQATG